MAQDAETHVDVNQAREYMNKVAEPVIAKLVQQLAVEQPEDVLAFIGTFAETEQRVRRGQLEREEELVCCVSGTPAELKVKLPGSDKVEFYARDIFDALKRKNKLRGAIAAELDEDFPVVEESPRPEIDPEEAARIAQAKTVDQVDDRPVTPPKRGFEMTRPGENYHPGAERRAPVNVGPVKFEPRALGTLMEDGETNQDAREAAREAAAKRLEEQEKAENLTPEQREQLKLKRKKDDIVGRIKAHYATMGGVEPLGLAASSIETLQKHLAKLKNKAHAEMPQRAEAAVKEEKTQKIAKMMSKGFLGGGGGAGGEAQRGLANAPAHVSFEPRALGKSSSNQEDQDESKLGEEKEEDSLAKRRERAALAAAKRFQTTA